MDWWMDGSTGVGVGGWLNGSKEIHVQGQADTHGQPQDALPGGCNPPAPADHAPAAPTLAHLCHAPPAPARQLPRRPALGRAELSIGQSPRPSSSQPIASAWAGARPGAGLASSLGAEGTDCCWGNSRWLRRVRLLLLGGAGEFQSVKACESEGCRAWSCTPVVRALGRLRQEDSQFETLLSYVGISKPD